MRRYPGITPFKQEDAPVFKGRKRESQEVKNLILTQKMLVLFAKSGMGKTSLLNAGVVPGLKKYGLYPIYIRFNEIGTSTNQDPVARFLDQYRQAYEDFNEHRTTVDSFQGASSLWETLCRNQLVTRQGVQIPVLIFDQFEEFFRTYPKKEQRIVFLQQLAELLSDTLPHGHPLESQQSTINGEVQPLNLRCVFSIRSDLLNQMQEASGYIPFVMRTRYQLNPLTQKQATESIREPGLVADGPYETGLITFPDNVLTDILTGLEDPYSGEIESFQLQLICSYLEDKYIHDANGLAASTAHTVTPTDYGGSKGIQKINEVYFTDTINSLTAQPRKQIIGLLATLLNINGNRILKEDSQLDLLPVVKDTLVDRRILKRDKIQANTYYEISHDKIALALWNEKALLEKELQEEQARLEAEKRKQEQQKKLKNWAWRIAGILLVFLGIVASWVTDMRANLRVESATHEKGLADSARQVAERIRNRAVTAEKQARDAELNSKIEAKKAKDAVRNLNYTRLENAWGDFELTKKLMAGRLFRQASINLASLQKRIPTNLAQIQGQDLNKKKTILNSYLKLTGLVGTAQTICQKLTPIQNLVENAACLEQNYYLACANKQYVEARKKQLYYVQQFGSYTYPNDVLATHIDLTNEDIRRNISLGINGSYRSTKDKEKISTSIDTLTSTCSCTSFLSKK